MTHPRHFCSIVPPYLLEHLADTGPADLAAGARTTLAHDQALRPARPGARPAEASSQRPARDNGTGPNRRVHDAKKATTLPGTLVRAEGAAPTIDPRSASPAWFGMVAGEMEDLAAPVEVRRRLATASRESGESILSLSDGSPLLLAASDESTGGSTVAAP